MIKSIVKRIVVSLLIAEAKATLARHRPKVIAITGNLGKTTAKDAIFHVLQTHVDARKSAKSFNSDIGVPLTILGLENPWSNPFLWFITLLRGLLIPFARTYPKLLILEVGADKPGDIRAIASWLKPDVAVFTGVPAVPVHVASFSSAEELMREKSSLFEYVKEDGVIIVNADDGHSAELRGRIARSAKTYGIDSSADFHARDIHIVYEHEKPVGMQAMMSAHNDTVPLILLGTIGKPRVYSALAACAVAEVFGVPLTDAVRALNSLEPTPGRMRLLDGINGSIIIDDSYNSSPAASHAALDALMAIKSNRKIALLGDMRELGSATKEAHREVGVHAAKFVDMLITVGEESHVLAEAARSSGLKNKQVSEYGYDSATEAGAGLAQHIEPGDVILVKGSQDRIHMERAVQKIMLHPEQASELLVRQDSSWLHKA